LINIQRRNNLTGVPLFIELLKDNPMGFRIRKSNKLQKVLIASLFLKRNISCMQQLEK
jgi:hypothetical protein